MFKQFLLAAGLALAALPAQAATLSNSGSYTGETRGLLLGISGNSSSYVQTFEATQTGQLSRVDLLLSQLNLSMFGLNRSDDATVSIYGTDQTLTPGTLLGSVSLPHDTIMTALSWVSVDVSGLGLSLNQGGTYGIGLRSQLGTGILVRGGAGYDGGALFNSTNGSFSAYPAMDMSFRSFVTQPAPQSGGATGTASANPPAIAPVPLPAAGFLLIAALGGLLALQRRR